MRIIGNECHVTNFHHMGNVRNSVIIDTVINRMILIFRHHNFQEKYIHIYNHNRQIIIIGIK